MADQHPQPVGGVHDGVLAALVDAAIGVAVRSGAGDYGRTLVQALATFAVLKPS